MDTSVLLAALAKLGAGLLDASGNPLPPSVPPVAPAAPASPAPAAPKPPVSPMRQRVEAAGGTDRFLARRGRQNAAASAAMAPALPPAPAPAAPPVPLFKAPLGQALSRIGGGIAKGVAGLPGAIRSSFGAGGMARQAIAMNVIPQMVGGIMQHRAAGRAQSGRGSGTIEGMQAKRQQYGVGGAV